MAIAESQLETWSSVGSVTQSSQTYATVKLALESKDAAYKDRSYSCFLQGSTETTRTSILIAMSMWSSRCKTSITTTQAA
jgi:hypothetical protein